MTIGNWIFIIIGISITIIGLIGFVNPNWTRLINLPGGPRIKSIGATITGLILIMVGLIIEIPME